MVICQIARMHAKFTAQAIQACTAKEKHGAWTGVKYPESLKLWLSNADITIKLDLIILGNILSL